MSQRECFNFNIPETHRPSKEETMNRIRLYAGDELAEKFSKLMAEPSDVDVLKPCEDDPAQMQKTNFIPPTWASEMKKNEPVMILQDEYKIENGKEWHNGK